MTLLESIKKLAGQNFTSENDWYNWRTINEAIIPYGLKLPEGNQYHKNMALKKELNAHWIETSDPQKKAALIEYYIKTWGGIKTNRHNSMNEYQTLDAESLISKGIKGIASWSKALVVHDFNKYAIYDARVSNSLNCLQIIDSVENKKLFPTLTSRNKTIIAANKKLKNIATKESWEQCDKSTLYVSYLKMLSNVAEDLKSNISTVEMLLFAKSEELTAKIL